MCLTPKTESGTCVTCPNCVSFRNFRLMQGLRPREGRRDE
ncbi:MAG TPA: hypothetical protein DCP66_01930 [Collinsella sp.]|nr:hypothetical protein DXC66_08060 [Collinsella sp. TF06-6AC]RHA18573.1 hypothetical protein DW943_08710 [Collinsella sp. AM44-11]HAM07555.1 hypothetical protein [Collinsella sp.]